MIIKGEAFGPPLFVHLGGDYSVSIGFVMMLISTRGGRTYDRLVEDRGRIYHGHGDQLS